MKNVMNINRSQITWLVITFIGLTIFLCLSIDLYFKKSNTQRLNLEAVTNHTQELNLLSTITVSSINIQRFSSNLLLNTSNYNEILFNKNSIQNNRKELTQAINEFVTLNNSIGAKKDSIAIVGNEYLAKNNIFLNLIESNDLAAAINFRIQQTRPLLDKLLMYDKIESDKISSDLVFTSAIDHSIFS
ncbi:MAG: hypothetical protein WCI97_07935, partial [Bacteroidota bacterium]